MTPERHRAKGRRGSIPALDGLVEAGYITAEQASDVLQAAIDSRGSLASVLRAEVGLDDATGGRALSALDYPVVDLVEFEINQEAVASIPAALGRRHSVVPIAFDGERLIVAMPDPTNVIAVDDVRTVTGRRVAVVIAEESAIQDLWVRQSSLDSSTESLLEEAIPDLEEEAKELDAADDAPIVRAINQILAQAVQQRASDMHIEPNERDVRIRYRMDGVLHEIMRIPKALHSGVISRMKVMADLNIAEKRVPQDGRMTVRVEGKPVDFRVATVPSVWGEEVILRILDNSSSLLTLEELGFRSDTLKLYESSFRKPSGAILVVGPTGSGKSSTLYSTLSVVNDEMRKIITVEDPVETRLPGVSQIQVNAKAGLTFATALRSILRSDPDIVMVGEIRDTETARIAVESAMTGHLVFSTLHTNDAPQAATRLIEMGVEPFLVASAIDCVLAQRLARRLCQRCREPYNPSRNLLDELGFEDVDTATFYKPGGCRHCSGTGYRGRIAMVELMRMSEEIEHLIVTRASSDEIRKVAVAQGMRSLRMDGLLKVRAGLTAVEEVLRIVEGRSDEADEIEEEAADSVVHLETRMATGTDEG